MTAFTDALAAAPPAEVHRLYWLARLTLVNRQQDIELFDRVFEAAFGDAVLAVDPNARRTGMERPEPSGDALVPLPREPGEARRQAPACRGTPCRGSRPGPTRTTSGPPLPELLPSAVARIAETPFDELDADELAVLGRLAGAGVAPLADPQEPAARGRAERAPAGAAGDDGRLAAYRLGADGAQALRPGTPSADVTLLCDVSQSMQGYATAYLHLMRVFARTRHAETFAFSTVADPAHAGARTALAGGGGRAGRGAGRRPVRRHPPRPLPDRAAPVAARQRRSAAASW